MEEEKKYYIPSIEEFHVGFEYESRGTGYTEFNKHTVEEDFDSCVYIDLIDNEEVRVKYLDKEDIESLGWVESSEGCYNYKIEESRFYIINSYQNLYIGDTESEVGFNGNIKNKSELKKLMQQLGIND